MIHECTNCHMKYLISHYYNAYDFCGDDDETWLELREVDGVMEWWELSSQAVHGEGEVRKQRWSIR